MVNAPRHCIAACIDTASPSCVNRLANFAGQMTPSCPMWKVASLRRRTSKPNRWLLHIDIVDVKTAEGKLRLFVNAILAFTTR